MKKVKNYLRVLLLVSIWALFGSWGFLVHRTQVQLALYELPRPMQNFFHRKMDRLVKEVVQPDLRRSVDSSENPRHFIDLEYYGDSAAWKMPLRWDDAVRQFSVATLQKNGYVPYEIMRVKTLLTEAFRRAVSDSIVFYAADLAHYIGDAHVPLHTTSNYDGQFSNQKGIHSLWETMIPEIELNQYNLYSRHKAEYLKNPEEKIWLAVRHAHEMLPQLFKEENDLGAFFPDSVKYRTQVRKGKPYKSYTSAFAMKYSAALGNSIDQQLLNAVDCIADFWYTAWVDAGKPDLNGMLSKEPGRNEKKELRWEKRAFRHNQLIQKQLLLSKKAEQNAE